MRLDAWASMRHFHDHIAGVWAALPEEVRGDYFAPQDVARWAARPGAPHRVVPRIGFPKRTSRSVVLVAGFADHHAVRPHPTVLLNHGAGQSYLADPAAKGAECFSGGPGRERVLLHLEPGPLAARASEAAGHRYVEVGSPRLDPWHRHERGMEPEAGLVGVGFHHDGRGCPEQRSAWIYYEEAIASLVANGVRVLGHGHPRNWGRIEQRWLKMGVEPEPDFARVLDRFTAFVTDSSSTGVEFASTGRPVVWCSAPWYRRGVDHGGRFWDWVRYGIHVQEPAQLPAAIDRALSDPAPVVVEQESYVRDVYVATDGRAAERAAEAITSLLAEMYATSSAGSACSAS